MKLLIFGATRGVGLEAAKQALARGHAVTAFARRPDAVPVGCIVIAGDVMDAAAVSSAVAAARPEAVLISLGGAGLWSRDFTCSQGTAHVLAGLKSAGLAPRLVLCSSMGVGDSSDKIPSFIAWMLKNALADKAPQEAAVRESGLPYTIVRPTGLRNAPARGRAACVLLEGAKLPTSGIARADVAAIMLDALTGDDLLGKTLGLSWATA